MPLPQDSVAGRLALFTRIPYSIFTGTTNGTANTSSTFSHGLVDANGTSVAPSFIVVTNTTGANTCYVGAASTATLADIRSTGISQAFTAIAFA